MKRSISLKRVQKYLRLSSFGSNKGTLVKYQMASYHISPFLLKKKKKEDITGIMQPIKGTRDFNPEEQRILDYIKDKWYHSSKLFNFDHYSTPIVESYDLYEKKTEGTNFEEDLKKEMYQFQDFSGQKLALRPEQTPSMARLVLKEGPKIIKPIKWYTIAQCWRYESTSPGRKREHYQWNVDIWGSKDVHVEAEILSLAVHFLKSIGFNSNDIVIRISSRQVLYNYLFDDLEDEEKLKKASFEKVCAVVDKLKKLNVEEINDHLDSITPPLPSSVKEKVLSLTTLDKKEVEALFFENERMHQLNSLLKAYKLEDWCEFDISIIRGLAYYTDTVFEGYTKNSNSYVGSRALFGGGRYDDLINQYDSKSHSPAVGFGFGDIVLLELMKEKKLVPDLVPSIQDFVVPFPKSNMESLAAEIVSSLRFKHGRVADIPLIKNWNLRKAFNYADRVGAERVILVAPDEVSRSMVTVKYLRETDESKKQEEISLQELL
mmetsp:Transcript_7850/g.11648  ORF Transcript_7850/g.11648 Transcript_7850/m.11648 type:complete len:490 (+) Transcript_7850:31-1500(+)